MWGFAKINSLVVNIICTVYSWNKYSTIIIILLLTVCIDPFTPFYTIYFGRLIACVFLYGPHESRDRLLDGHPNILESLSNMTTFVHYIEHQQSNFFDNLYFTMSHLNVFTGPDKIMRSSAMFEAKHESAPSFN